MGEPLGAQLSHRPPGSAPGSSYGMLPQVSFPKNWCTNYTPTASIFFKWFPCGRSSVIYVSAHPTGRGT